MCLTRVGDVETLLCLLLQRRRATAAWTGGYLNSLFATFTILITAFLQVVTSSKRSSFPAVFGGRAEAGCMHLINCSLK